LKDDYGMINERDRKLLLREIQELKEKIKENNRSSNDTFDSE
jgi:hypothetical protein